MRGWKPAALLITLLYTLAGPVALSEEQFNVPKVELIEKTASDICNTVKEAKGRKTETQTQAEVQARISGLAAKLVDIGGGVKALRGEEEFEGLSREATALGLQGDRECRERLFTKMFDKLGSVSSEKSNTSFVQPRPPTQQRQATAYGKRLTKDMLIDSRESRAGGIRFFDPPIDTVIVNNRIFRADFQLRLPGTYVFRLNRGQQRLRLACALSDGIRRNARYALRVIGDNNHIFEGNYSIGSDPVLKDIDIAGVEALVFNIAGSPTGDFMLFYCNDELVY